MILVEVKSLKPLKSKASITLDEEVIQSIKLLSEKDDRSFSSYINIILKEHIQQPEQQQVLEEINRR